ncbi:GNAT family N-acetyltransferase [Nocardioides sp.]|uniref:GNAT family N-acetyltransferase n=1 Tax=Nocardioides sp. TaxID=35761 RepID=UPI002C50A407|nr:GNAT family N-acetyltransferase [Nocardioides sp.]HXH80827.1 GNAT family N-acetyltransferase [Nocardioides sp.]
MNQSRLDSQPEVRPATPDDHVGIDRVIRDAFGAEDPSEGGKVATLWPDVHASGHVLAESVVVRDGRVVGHVGVSRCWIDARRSLVDAAVLSPLSTAPDYQGQGIGTALVAAAVAAAGTLGGPALFLEGSPAFYGSRGFVRSSKHGLEAPSPRAPDAAFQVVLFDAFEEWMRGRVVYPEVWWRHDAVGLRDPDLAFLEDLFARTFPPID